MSAMESQGSGKTQRRVRDAGSWMLDEKWKLKREKWKNNGFFSSFSISTIHFSTDCQ